MLELHTTPLMWATLLLLFFICLWWFIVEWGFSKSASNIPTTKKPAAPSQQHRQTNTDQEHHSIQAKSAIALQQADGHPASPPISRPNKNATNQLQQQNREALKQGRNTPNKTSINQSSTSTSIPKKDSQTRQHCSTKPDKSTGVTPDSAPSVKNSQTTTSTQNLQTQKSNQKIANATGRQEHPASSQSKLTNNGNAQNSGVETIKSTSYSLDPEAATTIQNTCSQQTPAHTVAKNTKPTQALPQPVKRVSHSTNSDCHKLTASPTRVEKQKPVSTTTDAAQSSDNKTSGTTSKYQTAAKARHPSSRSEASLQVPNPAAHKTRKHQTELKKSAQNQNNNSTSQQALNKNAEPVTSTIQKPHEDSKQPLKIASVKTTESTAPATRQEVRSNHGNKTKNSSNTIPFNKYQRPGSQSPGSKNLGSKHPGTQNRGTHRKQSSIEVAVALQISEIQPELSQAPIAKHLEESVNTKHASTPTSNSHLDETRSRSGSPIVKAADENPAVDGDAALRAQLASSERLIKSLQSTLNSVQNDPSDITSTATQKPRQHNRPSLLSKVRVLDHPRT